MQSNTKSLWPVAGATSVVLLGTPSACLSGYRLLKDMQNMNDSTNVIPRTTLTSMCGAYRQSEVDIRQAYGLMVQAEKRLKEAFGDHSYGFSMSNNHRYGDCDYDKPEKLIEKLKKDAWRILIDRMELRRVLSIKRVEQLDKQLETGEGLPEIEENQILAMLEDTLNNVSLYIEEAVKEVFDYLRPPHSQYKTNSEFEIGKRVVLTWAVSWGWGNNRMHVEYGREKNIRAIDNVFHALDGNGTIATYQGPLLEAINKSDGTGETDYFRFKGYHNKNLHLEFKRIDLVAKLNAVAGGMRLKPQN